MTYHLYNANFLKGEGSLETMTSLNNNDERVNFISSFSLKILLNNLATEHHSYSYNELQNYFFRAIDSLVNHIELSQNKTVLLYHHNHYEIFEYGQNALYQSLYRLAQLILEKFRQHQLALFYSHSLASSLGLTSLVYLLKNRHKLSRIDARRLAHQILYFKKNGVNGNLAHQQESMAFSNFINNETDNIA